MNADGFPLREIEIEFYGGRLDGKTLCGQAAMRVLRKAFDNDFRIDCQGVAYQIAAEGSYRDYKAYVRAIQIPPLVPR